MSINIHEPIGARSSRLLVVILFLPVSLPAQPASGGPYELTAASLNSAGGAGSAGIYRHHTACGEAVVITSEAGPVVAKSGSVAQLYEPMGMVLSAESPEVEEESIRTIYPFLVLDDTSLLAISPLALAWSVVAGPAFVSPVGVATGQTVAVDTPATIVADGAAFSATFDLTVKNLLPDNFGSYAGDGLADDWQVFHFGEDNPLASPDADADGDGQDNQFEFIAGSLPGDPVSRFKVRIETVPGEAAQKRVVFSPVFPDRTYTLLGSVNPDTGTEWLPILPVATTTAGEERSVIDLDAFEPSMFYTVEITRP